VDDEVSKQDASIRLVSLTVHSGTSTPPTAVLTLIKDAIEQMSTATGSGPVDAIFNAIQEIYPHDAELQLFQIHAVTQGTDAQAEVSVRLSEHGKTSQGHAANTDTLIAAASAYIQALNKVISKRQRSTPPAIAQA
jgi:2-isopropylmalate synthase